jgi:NAD-specific glutamate dehydrogenase
MYRLGGKVELSQAMPILEHLGLRVVEERPTLLLGGDGETWLQDFGVLGPTDLPLDLDECGERLADLIAAVWRGETESDSLNRLVISAGLDWRRIAILRAYRGYRQRIGSRFTEGYQNDVLAANPHVIAKLIRLFELRNDPAIARDEEAEAALREDILADLEAVPSRRRCVPTSTATGGARSPSSCARPTSRRSRTRRRCSRSTSTRPRSRGSTCAAARSRAAGCAGLTAWTTAPRSSA